jgi:hypothetical protein
MLELLLVLSLVLRPGSCDSVRKCLDLGSINARRRYAAGDNAVSLPHLAHEPHYNSD